MRAFEHKKHRRDQYRAACLQEHDPNDQPLTANQYVIHREGNRTGSLMADAAHDGALPSICTYEPSPVKIAGAL